MRSLPTAIRVQAVRDDVSHTLPARPRRASLAGGVSNRTSNPSRGRKESRLLCGPRRRGIALAGDGIAARTENAGHRGLNLKPWMNADERRLYNLVERVLGGLRHHSAGEVVRARNRLVICVYLRLSAVQLPFPD